MESLIDALQRITPWYEDPDGEVPPTFPRGLPYEELTKLLEYLPFQLPEEVCELYQWCNGSENPLAVGRRLQHTDVYTYDIGYMAKARVIPLKDAIDLWLESNDENTITQTWYHFPIFSHENGLIVIVGSEQMEDSSAIWDVDGLEDKLSEPIFPTLASMMTGIADVIEAEHEFLDDLGNFNQRGYWDACNKIWQKYYLPRKHSYYR
jgi:hypothetical protein